MSRPEIPEHERPRADPRPPADRRPPDRDFRRPPEHEPAYRARSPYRRLRRLLLALGVLTVAIVVLLLVAYNFGRSELPARTPGEAGEGAGEGMVSRSRQVRFVHSSGGRPVFEVRAETESQDERGVSHMTDVRVEFFRRDGESYVVLSDRATLDQNTLAALFEGHVQVRGLGDVELDARAMEVSRGGKIITSRGAVDFRWGEDLEGRASELKVNRELERMQLLGGVHVRSVPGVEPRLRLDAQRLVYDRNDGLVRAIDDVHLRRGGGELRADTLNVFLREDRSLRLVRARWNVRGGMKDVGLDGGVTRVSFEADRLDYQPAEADPGLIFGELYAEEEATGKRAILRSVRPDGSAQSMVGDLIEARVRDGRLLQVDAKETGSHRPVRLTEYLDVEPPHLLRQACARILNAGFRRDGALDQVRLLGEVEMSDARRHLDGGSQAAYNAADDRLEIEGDPVRLFDSRGDLRAPRMEVAMSRGVLRAEGGVEASLADGVRPALAGTPLGSGDGPILVQSERAVWTESPPTFVFLDEVRAWQGQNLVLAQQLRGDQEARELAASGGVTTVWMPADRGEKPGSTPGAGASARMRRPVEVRAEDMVYSARAGELRYYGGVRLSSDGQSLSCREMTVEVAEGAGSASGSATGAGAERMICFGNVELVDPVGGKRVTGASAIYEIEEDLIEVFGDEVVVVDRDGTRLQGRYLRYGLETGSSRLDSKVPESRQAPAGTFGPTAGESEEPTTSPESEDLAGEEAAGEEEAGEEEAGATGEGNGETGGPPGRENGRRPEMSERP